MPSSSKRVKLATEDVIDRFLNNVDVWQAIFKMLEVKDRIRLEITNKRLGILMLEYWKRVTSFDTQCLTEMSCNPSMSKKNWKKLSKAKRSATFFAICVNRIGDGLRSLTIRGGSTYPIGCWSANLASIGEGCPNIETINFMFEDNHMGENRTLDIGFDSFSRLKTITFSNGCALASASIFLSIPVSIEVIRGLEGKEPFENSAQMEGFFVDRPSLREVSLGLLRSRDGSKADIFRVIAERCPHLKSIKLHLADCIDYHGVVALESMKQLLIPDIDLNEMEIVTICERSPLVEALSFNFRVSSNIDRQSAALNALGILTKLRELRLYTHWKGDVVAPSLVTELVRDLARNSGASLRHLHLDSGMPLPTAAIEALANGCAKLRYLYFNVRVGEATPASIRFLIDCIVAHPSWITQTGVTTLEMRIFVIRDYGHEYIAGRAAFKALAAPASNLPDGVELIIID